MIPTYVYDIECYPNCFTLTAMNVETEKYRVFEVSPRKNDMGPLKGFIDSLRNKSGRLVGYNNIGYDYPVVHHLFTDVIEKRTDWKGITSALFKKSKEIINTPHQRRWDNRVAVWKHIVEQIDLFMIHHFDNAAKATSLKALEVNMRMKDVRDLPFPPETVLTNDQIDFLVKYNIHDVRATKQFYDESKPMIEFRQTLTNKYNRNFMNHNDTKIGKDYFVMELEQKLGMFACFEKVGGQRKAKQTKREAIDLNEVVLPYVEFETEQFQAVHRWLCSQVITGTKGVFTDLTEDQMKPFLKYTSVATKKRLRKDERRLWVNLDGIDFVFGTGGIHASVEKKRVESIDNLLLIDLDVTSYYPSLAIANRFYPEHLGEEFCDIYADMKAQRVKFPKGTPENAMLKLALNGVYGDSNNKFSPFYDPFYTMCITVNGQLLLCMLYEQLRKIEGLELVQVNTDGLTVRVHRDRVNEVERCRKDWEDLTGLELEEAHYNFMYIKDVNNYVAGYTGGGVKRKGAYEYKRGWHQDQSAMVVQKAAEAMIVDGVDPLTFLKEHDDPFDFMLRAKVPRSSKLMADYGCGLREQIQNITRYAVVHDGPQLVKVMPPLPKNPEKWREISIQQGHCVQILNNCDEFNWKNINYGWYLEKVQKLVNFGEYE